MSTTMIGNVTEQRYATLLSRAHEIVGTLTACQFALGNIAVEIEPIQPRGGNGGAGVYKILRAFADEIDVEFHTLLSYRDVAAAWPDRRRSTEASWRVHKILSHLPGRFEVIQHPPYHEGSGTYRWTCDAAARVAGHTPNHPNTSQERVSKIHDLARDDEVASQAASDLLRRPEVAHRVVSEPTTRHMLNSAHRDRDRQVADASRNRTPAVRQGEHSLQVVQLLGACSAFVAAINRAMPALRDHPVTDTERRAVDDHLTRVRAAADWCHTAITTGDTSLDDQLARLLRGDEP